MSGSPFLNQLTKLEHENDLLRDSYEEVSAHLEAMAKMRDTLKVELTKALEEIVKLRKELRKEGR
jgi:uncharacterized coiled-coil DUF342 family protein